MIRAVACIGLVVLLSGAAFSQSAEKLPVFEVADVHVSPPRTIPVMVGGVVRGGRYDLQNATMVDLIKTAFGVTEDKVIGGPSWLETERFDVIAKAPPSTTPEAASMMLRALLADRFKLTIHNDSKSLPAYVLSLGKGNPKLKDSSGSGPSGCQGQPPPPPLPGVIPSIVVSCHNMTMAAFAEQVHQMAGGYVGDHPVVDSTKLEGAWDFDIKWMGLMQLKNPASEGISIFDAVDKQLGLKLELQNIATPVIVVDKVNEKPTDNLPGVGQALPPVRTEFEVADVKPSAPGSTDRFIRPGPGGRWDASGPLRDIIGFASDINFPLRNDLLVGVPKWAETERYNIVAKAPAGSGADQRAPAALGTITDDITLRQMVRALLVDRFKLATHIENQPTTVFAIVIPKGEAKLKKADGAARAGCKLDRSAIPVTGSSGPAIAFRCQNTTMTDLAKNLQNWLGPDGIHPVVDTTGLEGGWDFVLSWTLMAPPTPPGAANQPAGATASAADPGGFTIFEALEKELGVKLEVQKQNIPVVVIDHVEPLHE